MNVENFWMFAITGLLLNLTPGNDMVYVMARSAGQGTKAGIVSALGIGTGCFVHILAAMAGLSALLAQSATAFAIIKYIGAAYLIYLGIRSLLSKKTTLPAGNPGQDLSYKKMFRQGVLTNILNPKVALFFLSFLPQFLTVHQGSPASQILFLGIWFDVSGTLVNVLVALLFGSVRTFLARSPGFVQWQERITGIVLIGLGIKMAVSSKK